MRRRSTSDLRFVAGVAYAAFFPWALLLNWKVGVFIGALSLSAFAWWWLGR